jgi:hypothetical protein
MTSLLRRLQDWYKSNCDGNWEHSYGIKIETLDNPGWAVKLDLQETELDEMQIKREWQNPNDENDWFTFAVKDGSLTVACGPDNLEQVLTIFLDEIAKRDK